MKRLLSFLNNAWLASNHTGAEKRPNFVVMLVFLGTMSTIQIFMFTRSVLPFY